jgi:aryl-alcohol dehydrogenase-like predicted oxidoreductase
MTKVCTHGRGRDLALRMLAESLRRLGTDHLDLWQIHRVSFDNDPELAYARGGVLEALEQAKRQGKTRFVGFTGHKGPGVHLEMLRRGFAFDTVQMLLNPIDATYRSFEQQVLPEVNRRGMGALGMKSLCGGGSRSYEFQEADLPPPSGAAPGSAVPYNSQRVVQSGCHRIRSTPGRRATARSTYGNTAARTSGDSMWRYSRSSMRTK